MHKSVKTLTLSGGTAGAEDWESVETVIGGPVRVFRIDIDDALVTAASPGLEFDDDAGTALAASDASTLLFTEDDDAVEHEGRIVAAVVAAVDACAENDEVVVTIFYE